MAESNKKKRKHTHTKNDANTGKHILLAIWIIIIIYTRNNGRKKAKNDRGCCLAITQILSYNRKYWNCHARSRSDRRFTMIYFEVVCAFSARCNLHLLLYLNAVRWHCAKWKFDGLATRNRIHTEPPMQPIFICSKLNCRLLCCAIWPTCLLRIETEREKETWTDKR